MKKISVRIVRRLPKIVWPVSLALVLAALPGLARAQSSVSPITQTLGVELTINGSCTLTSPPPVLVISATTALTTATTGSVSFGLTCSTGTAYTIGIGQSVLGNGTVGARLLSYFANNNGVQGTGKTTIPYGLYQDSSYTLPWENTLATQESGIGTGSAQTLTVYAQVPSESIAPPPGEYSDTVPLTITY